MKKRKTTTSLWNIVDLMQRTLEQQGLEAKDIDATVTRGVAGLVSALHPTLPWPDAVNGTAVRRAAPHNRS